MNLDALARVFAGVPDDAPAEQAAREGRAADARGTDARPDPTAGTIEGEPGARWYGFTVADLQTAAGVDWPVIADRPAAQDALALLLRTRAQGTAGNVRITTPKRPSVRTAARSSCGRVDWRI